MSPKKYRIPKSLERVHAYHPNTKKIIDFNIGLGLQNLRQNPTTKTKLLTKQKGKCKMCALSLLNEQGEFMYDGTTSIHHVVPRSEGGEKAKLTNLALVHTSCHVRHHQKEKK